MLTRVYEKNDAHITDEVGTVTEGNCCGQTPPSTRQIGVLLFTIMDTTCCPINFLYSVTERVVRQHNKNYQKLYALVELRAKSYHIYLINLCISLFKNNFKSDSFGRQASRM